MHCLAVEEGPEKEEKDEDLVWRMSGLLLTTDELIDALFSLSFIVESAAVDWSSK
jgi:hypothetical protein